MAELSNVNLSEMFGGQFLSTEDRLEQAYSDPIVRQRFRDMMHAPSEELPSLQAQLNAYLAAAYYLFPEESQVIHDSLESVKDA